MEVTEERGNEEGSTGGRACSELVCVVSLLWRWSKEQGGKQAEKKKCETESGEKASTRENGSVPTAGYEAVRAEQTDARSIALPIHIPIDRDIASTPSTR
jgi:hypothetical protein